MHKGLKFYTILNAHPPYKYSQLITFSINLIICNLLVLGGLSKIQNYTHQSSLV
jgi:hypothetical protein